MTELNQPYNQPYNEPSTGYGASQTGSSTGADSDDASMKDKATESAQAGKQAAAEVAQNAAGQAKEVAGEAKAQASNLVGEARDQLRNHAGDQHRNAVTNLRSLGDELHSMASNSDQNGMATDLVSKAADRTHGVADWLDGRQPEDLIEELRRFARRRPGAFLLGALAAGVVAGRLTRGVVASHSDDQTDQTDQTDGSATADRLSRPMGTARDTGIYSTPVGGYSSGSQPGSEAGYDTGYGTGHETDPGRHSGAETAWTGGTADPARPGGVA